MFLDTTITKQHFNFKTHKCCGDISQLHLYVRPHYIRFQHVCTRTDTQTNIWGDYIWLENPFSFEPKWIQKWNFLNYVKENKYHNWVF